MALAISHRGDHAVVTFNDGLTLETVAELIEAIDTLADAYFYGRIEVRLSSTGGLIQTVHHWQSALARWRSRGVTVRTRVLSSALSAASIMFALGDDRVVARGARLLFHRACVSEPGEVSADSLASLHGTLVRIDSQIVEDLADRALAGPRADAAPEMAFESDEQVVRTLFLGLPGLGDMTAKASAQSTEVLLRALGIFVHNAVADGDRDSLVSLYRSVFDDGSVLSGALARTLGLADRVAPADEAPARPADTSGAFPSLAVPEWHMLFGPDGAVPRSVLTRHMLVTGETGSGKTVSAVLPVLAAMARAPVGVLAGGLVIDPKRELAPPLRALAGDAVEHLETGTFALNLMSGPEWRLDDDLAAGRWVTAATRILHRARSLVPLSPLRVLGPHQVAGSDSEFFDREGSSFLLDVVAFVLMLLDPRAANPFDWCVDAAGSKWVEALVARARGGADERGPNVLALAGWALAGPLAAVAPAAAAPRPVTRAGGVGVVVEPPCEDWLWARIARAALDDWAAAPGEGRDLLQRVLTYWRASAQVDRQHAGVVGTARGACHEFVVPVVATTLYFGCEPGSAEAAHAGEVVDFAGLAACDPPPTHQRFVLFQPPREGLDLLAMALKASFFEGVFNDPVRSSSRTDLPLVGYIADEAHRFLSSDAVHGEQSFLDSCRSYAAFCLLSVQSLASIEHALVARGGGSVQDGAALSLIWTNTATKLSFRSADADIARRLSDLCPTRPGHAPVTQVRPLSTLATGECYALLADGRVERRQLEPFVPEAVAIDTAPEADPVPQVEVGRIEVPVPIALPAPDAAPQPALAQDVAAVSADAPAREAALAPPVGAGRRRWLARAAQRRRWRRGRFAVRGRSS